MLDGTFSRCTHHLNTHSGREYCTNGTLITALVVFSQVAFHSAVQSLVEDCVGTDTVDTVDSRSVQPIRVGRVKTYLKRTESKIRRTCDRVSEGRFEWRYSHSSASESSVVDRSVTNTFIFARTFFRRMSPNSLLTLAQAGLLDTQLGQLLVALIGMLVVMVVGRVVLKIAWRLVTIAVVVVGAALLLSTFGLL